MGTPVEYILSRLWVGDFPFSKVWGSLGLDVGTVTSFTYAYDHRALLPSNEMFRLPTLSVIESIKDGAPAFDNTP